MSTRSALVLRDPPFRDPRQRRVRVGCRGGLDAAKAPAGAPALVVRDKEDVRLLVVNDLEEFVPQRLGFLPVERRARAAQELVDPRIGVCPTVVGCTGLEELRGIEAQIE